MITTDDQTVRDMSVMPQTQGLVGASGRDVHQRLRHLSPLLPLARHLPDRASTRTTTTCSATRAPDGGYALLNDNQTSRSGCSRPGYHTVHIGKMPNGYGEFDQTYVPPGWRAPLGEFYGFVPDPPVGLLRLQAERERDRQAVRGHATTRPTSTPRRRNQAINDNLAMRPDTPLFMMLQFFAPHDPAAPATRHDGLFSTAAAAR